jgi:RNA polymerase sigma-70 factor (ECF subfamily)
MPEEVDIAMMGPETEPQTAGVERWIEEGRQGSRVALNQLFKACLPYLLTAAHQELGVALRSRIDAADVVQETLIEACRDFPCFQGRTEKDLLAWLRQVLRNNLANERRRHLQTAMRDIRCEIPLTEDALDRAGSLACREWESPSERAQARERTEALEQALRQLPEHYRQVLCLRTWEELTFAQVGKRLRCSTEAARKLWGRAAEELATVLGGARAAWQRIGYG